MNSEHLAEIFKALSNPNRLDIFLWVAQELGEDQKECYSPEQIDACQRCLGEQFNLAPSTVSHHLKELVRAGLINRRRCGKTVVLSLNPETLEIINQFIHNIK